MATSSAHRNVEVNVIATLVTLMMAAPSAGSKVTMNGHCAVVAQSSLYGQDGVGAWDFKIKVEPWLVFGRVELHFNGIGLGVNAVWAASMLSADYDADGVRVVVSLGHQPQQDQQFDISGSGMLLGSPTIIRCSGLKAPPTDCDLGPTLRVVNQYANVSSLQVRMQTWQQGADVTLSFSPAVVLSELWGAGAPDGQDATGELSSSIRFHLQPPTPHLSLDRLSSFGFIVSPIPKAMPTISCKPIIPFPPPPPPGLPSPAPSPPPFLMANRQDCFLGGRATFIRSPAVFPGLPWELKIELQRWKPGATVILNFVKQKGSRTDNQPLRVANLFPPSAITQSLSTSHSIVLQLLQTPIRTFSLVATGAVDHISNLECCCAESPRPPPPSPFTPPPPSRPPRAPPRPWWPGGGDKDAAALRFFQAQGLIADGQVILGAPTGMSAADRAALAAQQASSAWTARRVTAVTTPFVLFGMLLCACAYSCAAGLCTAGGRARRKLARLRARASRANRYSSRTLVALSEEELAERSSVSSPGSLYPLSPPRVGRGSSDGTVQLVRLTKLVVPSDEPQTLKVPLEWCESMVDLQQLVVELCDEAGCGWAASEMTMEYQQEPEGSWTTVTRNVAMSRIKAAHALRLTPAKSTRAH